MFWTYKHNIWISNTIGEPQANREKVIVKLWTGPPQEGEDSSLSTSNHSAAGPQARTGVKQVDSLFKTAKNKEDTHRTRTICFIFLQQQKKQRGHSPYLKNLLNVYNSKK